MQPSLMTQSYRSFLSLQVEWSNMLAQANHQNGNNHLKSRHYKTKSKSLNRTRYAFTPFVTLTGC